MTNIIWSQQIPTGPIHVALIRQHQLQSVELNSKPEPGPWAPWVPSNRTCDLSSLGWKVPPWEVLSMLCRQSRGTWDVHRQKWCLAPPHPHSQTSPWSCPGKNCSGWAPDVHSLDVQSVHSLLPGPLLTWRWLCLRVNYMWLEQVLHAVLFSSKDSVWLSSLRC